MMCFPFGAQPYRVYKLEEAPKKKEEKKKPEEKKEYRMFDQEAYDELYGAPAPPISYAAQPGYAYMPGPAIAYAAPAGVILPGPTPAPEPAPKALPASGGDKFWCKELDGSYTLRTGKEIGNDLQPGKWAHDKESGWPYWVRSEKKKD